MTVRQSELLSNGQTGIISMQTDAALLWHEVAVSFFQADGVTPYGDLASGSCALSVVGAFADQSEAGSAVLNLPTGERRWAPFLSGIKEVRVLVQNIPADARCLVTVITSATT